MRLCFAANYDFPEVQRRFFVGDWRTRRRGIPTLLKNDGIKGLLVRSTGSGELLGAALYKIVEGQLAVSAFKCNPLNKEVGSLLVNGLRNAAHESEVNTVVLTQDEDREMGNLLVQCGFQFMGYFAQDPSDLNSPTVECWKLATLLAD